MRIQPTGPCILAVLAIILLLAAPALADTAKPVLSLSDYKVAPAAIVNAADVGPLMPGDTGTVDVTITNTLKSPGTGTTTTASDTQNYYTDVSTQTVGRSVATSTSSSDVTTGTATIKSVALQDSGPIHVVSQSYANPGSLGMGDSATFDFTVQADSNASPGKYYLPLTVTTGDGSVYLNQYVPVVVSSGGVRLVIDSAPSSVGASSGSVVMDVVNDMDGGITSASVVPSGDGYVFNPVQEYSVGSIGAGQLYTVTFTVSAKSPPANSSPSFVVRYKNGDNWHQSAPATLSLDTSAAGSTGTSSDSGGFAYLLVGILLLIVVVGGAFLFLRSKRAKQ